ncbi:outer dense fiber protein 3-B-like [Sitodiplosis mosellana]|uniref:outer dense fiber protein 3-B-like n=1 Tax=Sitodiplosis mosellana TaxID=263140 RepID=UPI00244497CF|nr:outer dense fiber protein 3-B-like [Sitodiplosis mosellana]
MSKKCSPSPARYSLPTTVGFNNHDIRKNRMPAYTFGLRLQDKDAFTTPAPNAYKLPSIIGGQDQTFQRAPAHSMHKRLPEKEAFQSPAPNAYSLQNFKPGIRAPAYTMGAKLKNLSETTEC